MTEITFKRAAAGALLAGSLASSACSPTTAPQNPTVVSQASAASAITPAKDLRENNKNIQPIADTLRGDDTNTSAVCRMRWTYDVDENKKIMEPVVEAFRKNDNDTLKSFSGDALLLKNAVLILDIQNPSHKSPKDTWHIQGIVQSQISENNECGIWWRTSTDSYQGLKDEYGINAVQLNKVYLPNEGPKGEIKLVGSLRFDTKEQEEKMLAGVPFEPTKNGFVRVLETDKFLKILSSINTKIIDAMAKELGPFPSEYKQYSLSETGK